MSLILLLFCFILSCFMMQAAYVNMKELLSKQLRNIRIRHRWIKRRISHDIKSFGVFADKVFDSMFLSIKSIGTHSVRFIISYTIPILLAFSVVYYKDSVREETKAEKEYMNKQSIIESKQQEIKQLQDSLSVLEIRVKELSAKK